MKIFFSFVVWILLASTADAALLKVGTYNMQGWTDSSDARFKKLQKIFRAQGMMKDVDLLMVQESIEHWPQSTAQQLATQMGWKSFSHRRVSDAEGLGFIYPTSTKVLEQEVYQVQAKDSPQDYSRMALSMEIQQIHIGKVRFVNTHLAHLPNMGLTRKRQLAEILVWVRKLEQKNPSQVIIFGGDFNTGPSETYYAGEMNILTNSIFRFRLAVNVGASYTWIDKAAGQQENIDHFLISQSTTKARISSGYAQIFTKPSEQDLSDHNLVVLNLN